MSELEGQSETVSKHLFGTKHLKPRTLKARERYPRCTYPKKIKFLPCLDCKHIHVTRRGKGWCSVKQHSCSEVFHYIKVKGLDACDSFKQRLDPVKRMNVQGCRDVRWTEPMKPHALRYWSNERALTQYY
jgi:hypothetical protein